MNRAAPKDLFTCQASWQGSQEDSCNASLLTKLVHLPGKPAGVGCLTQLPV